MACRKVPFTVAYRVAKNTLGRMACAYLDPADPGHDHGSECLIDDESYAADLMLRVVAAAVAADDGGMLALDRLTDLIDSIDINE